MLANLLFNIPGNKPEVKNRAQPSLHSLSTCTSSVLREPVQASEWGSLHTPLDRS